MNGPQREGFGGPGREDDEATEGTGEGVQECRVGGAECRVGLNRQHQLRASTAVLSMIFSFRAHDFR